jgi:TonB-linked SusC/RagA family outer membrane protein
MIKVLRWGLFLFACCFSTALLAQQNITGVLVDENGMTVPGASVVLEGTTMGSSTDLDGKFLIENVPAGAYNLKVSFIGYKTLLLPVTVEAGKAPAPLSVKLEVDAQKLEELVVVGYGVQRKREVTGSIAKVESKDITALPVPSFESALQGKAAGVQVTTGSGLAGSPALIRIRGIASVSAGGDPLYVVDGIPITQDYFLRGNGGGMNTNPLAAINPGDIESVEILKDAAATGIYGSRGANGVILITTKRGKTKGLSVDLNTRWGVSLPTARPNMLGSDDYLQMYQEAWENDGNTGRADLPNNVSWETAENTNTDWVDETIGTGFKQMYSIGVNTRKEKWGLFGNFTYDDNESYLKGNSYERMSGRLNFDYDVSDKVKLQVSSSLSQGLNNRIDAAWSGGLGAAMSTALPIYPIRWDSTQLANPATGEYEIDPNTGDTIPYANAGDYWREGGAGNNPVAMRDWKSWRTQEIRSINNVRINVMPIENLVVTGTGGYEYMRIRDDIWESSELLQDGSVGAGVAKRYPVWVNNYNGSLFGNYNWQPTKEHDFKFMAGSEFQYSRTERKNLIEYTHIDGPLYDAESDSMRADQDGPTEQWSFISYFGRVNYMLKNKYIAQLTGRVDGSSKFGPNNKYGFFPSASVGWVMSEEDFMQSQNVISYFKWKFSIGRTGNANLPVDKYYARYSPPENNATYNGNPILYKIELDNPNLQWEVSTNWDIAAEIGFLDDRITMEAAYYRKYASDVLMRVQLPQSLGYGEYWDNVGEILNRGWELSVKSRNLVGPLSWTTNFNMAHNYNEVMSIGLYTEDAILGGTNDTRVVVGYPIGTNFLVRSAGIDPETGKPMYFTKDGELTDKWNPDDRVPVGDVLPEVIGGLNNTWAWKNWDLNLDIVYSFGAKIYDSSSKRQLGVVTDWNMRTEIFDRWRKPGDNDVDYARLTRDTETYGSGTPWINTDQWLKDGDYIRFRRLAVGYNFQPFNIKKVNIQRLRIEGSMTNFFTWTNFEGLDPEIARDFENAADRNMSGNVTYLTPPQERTYNIALSVTF